MVVVAFPVNVASVVIIDDVEVENGTNQSARTVAKITPPINAPIVKHRLQSHRGA